MCKCPLALTVGLLALSMACEPRAKNKDEPEPQASARCGDGAVDDGEDCDDGDANSDTQANACRTSCVVAACGDSVVDDGEACDDGDANSDTEPSACRLGCIAPVCGDGIVDDDEQCDDGFADVCTAMDDTPWLGCFARQDHDLLLGANTTIETVYAARGADGTLIVSLTDLSSTWRILQSTDDGDSWTTIDSSGPDRLGYAVAIDANGRIYATGAEKIGQNYRGVVRIFDGTTWSDAFTTQLEDGRTTYFAGVDIDSVGAVYVAGAGTFTTPGGVFPDVSTLAALVFKSSDNGASWDLVDQFVNDDAGATSAFGVMIDDDDDVYVYGNSATLNPPRSYVRKSDDAGASFHSVYENFSQRIESLVSWNGGIAFDQSVPGGTSYQILATTDDFAHTSVLDERIAANGATLLFAALGVDAAGELYQLGSSTEADGSTAVILRLNRGDGVWHDIDSHRGTPSRGAVPTTVFFNDDGDVLYAANEWSSDAPNDSQLVIYKAARQTPPVVSVLPLEEGDAVTAPIPAGSKRIFVTAKTHDGRWGATAAAATAAADAFCEADPNKPAAAGGAYRALLVNAARVACTSANCETDGTGEHVDWVMAPNTTYVNRRGETLGVTTSAGVIPAESFVRLRKGGLEFAWTGVDPIARDWQGFDHCLDWTSNSESDYGATWYFTDELTMSGEWPYCDTVHPIVCVEQ